MKKQRGKKLLTAMVLAASLGTNVVQWMKSNEGKTLTEHQVEALCQAQDVQSRFMAQMKAINNGRILTADHDNEAARVLSATQQEAQVLKQANIDLVDMGNRQVVAWNALHRVVQDVIRLHLKFNSDNPGNIDKFIRELQILADEADQAAPLVHLLNGELSPEYQHKVLLDFSKDVTKNVNAVFSEAGETRTGTDRGWESNKSEVLRLLDRIKDDLRAEVARQIQLFNSE